MAEYKGWKLTVEHELRLCEVDGELGYFHTWEQFSKPIPESLLRGGAPAGVISHVFGIVEFKDGVRRVDPYRIKFCDEINDVLTSMTEAIEKVKDSEGVNDEST